MHFCRNLQRCLAIVLPLLSFLLALYALPFQKQTLTQPNIGVKEDTVFLTLTKNVHFLLSLLSSTGEINF